MLKVTIELNRKRFIEVLDKSVFSRFTNTAINEIYDFYSNLYGDEGRGTNVFSVFTENELGIMDFGDMKLSFIEEFKSIKDLFKKYRKFLINIDPTLVPEDYNSIMDVIYGCTTVICGDPKCIIIEKIK